MSNNMINFITLTDLDSNKIEINPSFIVTMSRTTHEPEDEIQIPITKIFISTGHAIYVMETPEQVAQLQFDSFKNVMSQVMEITTDIILDLDTDTFPTD